MLWSLRLNVNIFLKSAVGFNGANVDDVKFLNQIGQKFFINLI